MNKKNIKLILFQFFFLPYNFKWVNIYYILLLLLIKIKLKLEIDISFLLLMAFSILCTQTAFYVMYVDLCEVLTEQLKYLFQL